MIILIDMDGPLADFEGGFIENLKQKYSYIKPIEIQQRDTFYIRDQYLKEFRPQIEEIYTSPKFIENLTPTPGSIEAIKEMRLIGFEIFICTSPLSVYDPNVVEKYRWIERYLGHDFTKKIILTKDKTLVQGDFLIDDKPEIKGINKKQWKHIIFDAPYNQHVTELRVSKDWSNWRDVLRDNK